MISLERRYRVLLRLLPPSYRQAWEPDMVATFLETETARLPDEQAELEMYGRSFPSMAEIVSVVGLAAGLRLGIIGPHASLRATAWRTAFRLVALIGLLVPAAFAVTVVPATVLTTARIPREHIVLTVGTGLCWMLAMPVAAAVLVAVNVPGLFGVLIWWNPPGALCLAAVIAAIVLPVLGRREVLEPLSCWLAVAVLGPIAAVLQGLTLLTMMWTLGGTAGWGYLILGMLVQACAAGTVGVIAVLRVGRLFGGSTPDRLEIATA
ncbi:MFS family permease [Nakamurella sp. UYEF19]|uniref:hypothetical protein n=1 Tax=Nakamurella sp. UYEF19 TaxID=1756392 RepID=UPI00339579F6